jgi:hypothetical protein
MNDAGLGLLTRCMSSIAIFQLNYGAIFWDIRALVHPIGHPMAIDKFLCSFGLHVPDLSRLSWGNSASGSGFDVSYCGRCGTELTRRRGSKWRAIALADR